MSDPGGSGPSSVGWTGARAAPRLGLGGIGPGRWVLVPPAECARRRSRAVARPDHRREADHHDVAHTHVRLQHVCARRPRDRAHRSHFHDTSAAVPAHRMGTRRRDGDRAPETATCSGCTEPWAMADARNREPHPSNRIPRDGRDRELPRRDAVPCMLSSWAGNDVGEVCAVGDWAELWVRKTALWWFVLVAFGTWSLEEEWLPWRILTVLIAAAALTRVARTTWELSHDSRPAKERLEQHIEESPAP